MPVISDGRGGVPCAPLQTTAVNQLDFGHTRIMSPSWKVKSQSYSAVKFVVAAGK
jgi:hypothetical protein